MDRLEDYRRIIRRILAEHLEYGPTETEVETVGVSDETGGHYLLIEIGWQPPRRVYSVVFHLRLKDDKIWIEQDWTKPGLARELLNAGVPAEAIELGFQPPELRPYSELATSISYHRR